MASYITKADIENVFGKDNVAQWSNLDGEVDADVARINTAIAVAEEDVENRFRDGRYTLPFNPVSEVVKKWCATLAGLWLFSNRPAYRHDEEDMEGFSDLKSEVDDEIAAYQSGQRRLNCQLADDVIPGSPVVVT